MTTALSRLSGSAFELTLTVPWADVKAVYDQVFEEFSSEIEIEGFRKGKAPSHLVAEKIDKSKVYGEVVNRILPKAYSDALKEHNLQPIISPSVNISSAEEDKDWQFIAKSSEKPEVKLNDYQQKVKDLNAKGKIWTPGQDENKKDESDEAKQKHLSEIMNILLAACEIELPQILVESEVNRIMTQLIDDVRTAGLTYEQYLASKNLTAVQLRENYVRQVTDTLKLEFVLEAVADDQIISVSKEEIEAVINKETDANKKMALKSQSYAIASILRRDKTLTKLLVL